MTNPTDNVPTGQHNSNVRKGSSISNTKPVSEQVQQCATKSADEASSRSGIMRRLAEQTTASTTTYVTPENRGTPPSMLNMNEMGAMLPVHTNPYDQYHLIPQQFVPTAHPHGVLYSLHTLPSYPNSHLSPNSVSHNHQFSQAYPLYVQIQHQSAPHSHNPGYHSVNDASPTPFGVPVSSRAVGHGHNYYHYQQHHQGARQRSPLVCDQYPLRIPNHAGMDASPGVPKPADTTQPPLGAKPQALNTDYDVSKTIVDGSTFMKSSPTHSSCTGSTSVALKQTSSSVPKGPSRKPKQSGHALWVGNLPSGATIVDLKDYFSQDATKDMESVFLISRSNCAFVNYKTEAACNAALERFNDSRFHGTRLVCRLRRAPVITTSNLDPFGPSTLVQEGDGRRGVDSNEGSEGYSGLKGTVRCEPGSWVPNRYFVVKSLTVDDLECSRRSGLWATQSHNQDCLNKAYESAENVYLVFSANKSGEYYGYARMVSPIQEDDALTLAMPPRPSSVHPETPILDPTPTPATGTARTGRIVNDAARGTVFWEADSSADEEDAKGERNAADAIEETTEPGFHSVGNPFRIQWLSTERVPFHRTKGLRNPWNANREIKIARDGTEIEPHVGARLMQLFHPTE